MQITAERFVQIGQFDKTINAKIVDRDAEDDMLYYVSVTGCSRMPVRKSADDATIYLVNDDVYVSIPNGNFSSPDKLIIGKINNYSYSSKFKKPEDYLFDISQVKIDKKFSFSNKECYSTLIIEFSPIIKDKIEGALGIKEEVFSYIITYEDSEAIEKKIKGIWSTNYLYGAIFNKDIPNKQYLIITGLENCRNVNFFWEEEKINNYKVTPITFEGKELTTTTKINIINNQRAYFNYSFDELEEMAVLDTVVKLTGNGYILFRKKYKKQDTDPDTHWERIGTGYNYLEKDLNEFDKDTNYTWRIEWYQKNLGLFEDEKVSYVPDGWEKIENITKTMNYKNKMVCLVAVPKDIDPEKETALNRKVLYSIYE